MRILFTFTSGAGHFYPLVPLAAAARAAGHAVAFAGSPQLLPQVEAAGFHALAAGTYRGGTSEEVALRERIRALPTIAGREALTLSEGFAGVAARRKVPDILRVCEAWTPDVLARDELDFGSCVAAERLGLPHAAVLVLAAGSFVRPELIAAPLNDLRAAIGLAPDPGLAMLHRYLVLAPFPPSYRDPAFPLPPTGHALRPLATDRLSDEGLPAWLAELPDWPIVYFSLGTSWNALRPDAFAPVIAGLRDAPLTLIVTVGRDMDPAQLGTPPPNVHVEQYIPLSLLLPRCDLVVSPGGSGTVMAAMAHGLPLVLLPLGADHPQNAERCAGLGVARVVEAAALSPRAIADAVAAVLADPGYRRNAKRLRDEIRTLPGPEHGAALLARLAAERQPLISSPDCP